MPIEKIRKIWPGGLSEFFGMEPIRFRNRTCRHYGRFDSLGIEENKRATNAKNKM